MEENIRNYFCKFCKKIGGQDCMQIQTIQSPKFVCYFCVNYQNSIQLESYKKYIKYDFYDDDGNKVAIIKQRTPKDAIVELRKHYDFVKHRD